MPWRHFFAFHQIDITVFILFGLFTIFWNVHKNVKFGKNHTFGNELIFGCSWFLSKLFSKYYKIETAVYNKKIFNTLYP